MSGEHTPGGYYADELVTPHPLRHAGEDEPESLSAVIRCLEFGEALGELALAGDQAEYEEHALAAAQIVIPEVREALWYPQKKVGRNDFEMLGIEDPISLAALEKQAADCFGFTIVASECLEMSGVGHWIGFANGHATLLQPTDEGQRLHLTDPLSPILSQDLEHSMVRGGSGDHSVMDDMTEYGRSAIELNSLSLAINARDDTHKLLIEHPWLVFRRGERSVDPIGYAATLLSSLDPYGDRVHPSKARIFMSVFMPEEGRQMLQDYDDFQHAYRRGQYMDAAWILYDRLDGSFPDIDARQSHSRIKRIIHELARSNDANYARGVLERYFSGFEMVKDDSRVPEAHADCLRIVAREAGDAEAASEAVDLYRRVLTYGRSYKGMVAGKLAKATRMAAELSTDPSGT